MSHYYFIGSSSPSDQVQNSSQTIFKKLKYSPSNIVKIIGRELIIAMLDVNGYAFVYFGSKKCFIVKNYSKLANVKPLEVEDNGDEIVDIQVSKFFEPVMVYFITRNQKIFVLNTEKESLREHYTKNEFDSNGYRHLERLFTYQMERGYTSPLLYYAYSWNTFKKVDILQTDTLVILTNYGEMKYFNQQQWDKTISLKNGEKIHDFAVCSNNSIMVQTCKRKFFRIFFEFNCHPWKFNDYIVELPFEFGDGDSVNLVGSESGFILRHEKENNYEREMIFDMLFCGKEILDEREILRENFIRVGAAADFYVNVEFLKRISKDLGNLISDEIVLNNLDIENSNILKNLIITICKLSQFPDTNNDEYMENSRVQIIVENFVNTLESQTKNVIASLAFLGNISDIGLSLKLYLFSKIVDVLSESNVCSLIEMIAFWLKQYPKSMLLNTLMGRCLSFVSENRRTVIYQGTKMSGPIHTAISSMKLKKSQLYNINWIELPNEKPLHSIYSEYLESIEGNQLISIVINEEKTEILKVSRLSMILASPVFQQLISKNDEENSIDLFEFQKMLIENSTEIYYQNVDMTKHLKFIIQICSSKPELIHSMEKFSITELVAITMTAHHFQLEKLFNYATLLLMNSNTSNKKELELLLGVIDLLDFDLERYYCGLLKFGITFSEQFLKENVKSKTLLAKIVKLKEFYTNKTELRIV